MAIKEKFGHAVIGTEAGDIEQALIQIHRSEINLVSAYRPQNPAIRHYLQGLDIEKTYMKPTEQNPYPEYGVQPCYFFYTAYNNKLEISGDVPEGEGRDRLLDHIKSGARTFSQVTGFEDIQIMWRLQGVTKDNLCAHIDNQVTYRGLETLDLDGESDDVQTLWLPDHFIDWSKFWCQHDEQGSMSANELSMGFRERAGLEQIARHHMSIHKGSAFANPLVHTSPGLCPELNLKPKTRAILTYDQAS